MKAINQDAVCEEHDINFVQTVIRGEDGKEVRRSTCPACAAEMLDKPREEDVAERNALDEENRKRRTAGIFSESGIPPRYTTRSVDNFHAETEKQIKALSSVKNYIAKIDTVNEHGTSMIMTGDVGTGKTHLACAIGNEFLAKRK